MFLTHKNIRISNQTINLGTHHQGLGEMFEGDSADTLTGKFPLVSMGGREEGLACADLVARTLIGVSGIQLVVDWWPFMLAPSRSQELKFVELLFVTILDIGIWK